MKELDGKHVDYEATMTTKLSIVKKIFDLEKDSILNSTSFKKVLLENEEWLKPYAAFCFLRDFFETLDHIQWGTFSQFSKNKLSEAALYAKEKGVVLKGDLPIGVDRNSVKTGGPPDYFDKNGQNWGFPTYNWEEMSKDNYAWWRARLSQDCPQVHGNAAKSLCAICRYTPPGLAAKISNPSFIARLFHHALVELRPRAVLVNALSEELEKEGIWDIDRLSKPYILQEFLQDKFGPSWIVVASHFMNESQKNRYEFKDDCNTEKKVVIKLKSLIEKSLLLESEDKLRCGLFDILQ
ncbi:hypothetical protein L2E82_43222 [Cichorium intybus]|uniref:Uncharacterized protein n=1 Tax=Cichorium intybus TaxID=13427 RepID=A0ACB8ZNT1_CICIN|nr:hypothetical protein L2E82_43222 [Cichorium intybus]